MRQFDAELFFYIRTLLGFSVGASHVVGCAARASVIGPMGCQCFKMLFADKEWKAPLNALGLRSNETAEEPDPESPQAAVQAVPSVPSTRLSGALRLAE